VKTQDEESKLSKAKHDVNEFLQEAPIIYHEDSCAFCSELL